MSRLVLTEDDIRKAIRQYYETYEPEIFKKFEFSDIEFFTPVSGALGHLDAIVKNNEEAANNEN